MTGAVDRLAAALAERYQLERELGRGGMATVYRARDLRHDRAVAIKMLRQDLGAVLGTERFLREIRTTAGLQHPHILPLLDSGAAEALVYYVMPLVEGETLRDRLLREKQLPVDEAVRLVREVADALQYAHDRDIIHRDVKPENILLSGGHAQVADFGIARAAKAAGGERLTETGLSLGTPAYMSPEQASGDRDLDARADQYSLACVAYELLAGQPPFVGASSAAVMARHIVDPVPPLTTVRPDVAAHVAAAIERALAKGPAARFPSVTAFVEALGRSPSKVGDPRPSEGLGDHSVAVLPFASLSPEPANEWFADGLADELITALAQVSGLGVIARGSAFAFKGRPADVKEVGSRLGVRYVVEGSVRAAGNRLRISAELADARTGRQVWSAKFDRELQDIFAVQDEIATTVRDAVSPMVMGVPSQWRNAQATDAETYALYLKGKHLLAQSVTRFEEAEACLRQACERDPGFVPGLGTLGETYLFRTMMGQVSPERGAGLVRDLSERVTAADPGGAVAQRLLGAVRFFLDWSWHQGLAAIDRAVLQSPADVSARVLRAVMRSAVGDLEGSAADGNVLVALDPLSPLSHAWLGQILQWASRYDEATRTAEHVTSLDPHYPEGYHMRGIVELCRGCPEKAIPLLSEAVRLNGRMPWPVAKLGSALAAVGRVDEAKALLDELVARSRTEYVFNTALAFLHHALGDREGCWRRLERAFALRDTYVPFLAIDPLMDRLRGDPVFDRLVGGLGLPAPRAGAAGTDSAER